MTCAGISESGPAGKEKGMREGIMKIRHNVKNVSSISAFADIRGGFGEDGKDVYFIRMLGMDAAYLDEIRKMDRLLSEQAAKGQGKYQRLSELPRLVSSEDVNYYSGCYENWNRNGRRTLELKVSGQNETLKEFLGAACSEAVRLFGQATPHSSVSMEKNFAVKLMFWADRAVKELLQGFCPEDRMKLVMPNVTKKQEYLFACFMFYLGVDVLLLQYQSDIDAQLERLNLSKKAELGAFGACSLPAYEPYVPAPAVPPHTERRNNRPAAARERKPLEVRRAGENRGQAPGTGRQERMPQRTGRTVPDAGQAQRNQAGSGSSRGTDVRRELDFEELALLASSVVMISVHDKKGEVLGNGSGIMIGEGGYILTNHHVASGGRFYSVRIEDDNTIYKTDEVIKYNSVLDLAVIRIDRRLKPLRIYAGGRKLVRGQKVVAIGSPLGLFNSVSDGIISGFRVINDVDMIQFTAPISHGSSGGAVLNMYGEVIGISTAGFDNGQNINLAVGYEFITQFVSGFTGQYGK